MYAIEITTKSTLETAALARALGQFVRVGDTLLLVGALASGKTFFIQQLVHSLGSFDRVTSPTYAIANLYQTNAGPFLHVDAYRISSVAEFRDLGFDELDGSIVAIEWGEKFQSEFPDSLCIAFAFIEGSAEERRIALSGNDKRWTTELENLRAEFQRALP